ncbi:MAG: hypothetical protein M0R80_29095 [Proteobacteria bacterium]|jgi:hypothetical protein|nr:hypothetical protein [Pseudomonadota bacterium]
MAKCARCGDGGAKRPCPALEGNLCPRCCAQHQRREVQCPDGCGFLRQGGGKEGYETALRKLLDFSVRNADRARQAFERLAAPDDPFDEWEGPLALAYLAYGHADANGDRSIDLLLREQGWALKAAEVEALEALRDTAWPSLFEVQEVQVDHGFRVVDLVVGDEVFVREKAATHQMKRLDLFLGWLVRIGDHFEMTGAGYGVPRTHRETMLKALTKELRSLRKMHPGTPDRALLREAIPAGQAAMRAAVANWRPPKMVTMDGEDLVFCEAVFDVIDLDAVRARLAAHPDMEEDDDGFTWVDRKGRKQLGDGPLHLGTIRLERGRMTLETKSRERLERGKALLAELLDGAARHRIDSMKDLDVAMAEHAARPAREPVDAIPEHVQAELLAPYFQQQIEAWIDEPIPLLKGKTPRQSVKTKAGRDKVVAMLKDQENSLQHQPGGELVDFSRVYRELGLID